MYLHPDTMTVKMVIKELKCKNDSISCKNIENAALLVCEKIKKLEDLIAFPPQLQDLKPEKFELTIHLSLFLTIAFTGNTDQKISWQG